MYLYEFHLTGETVDSSKHQTRLKVPLHHWPFLEVLPQVCLPVLVVLSILATDVEGHLQLLQALVWLHLQNLVRYVVVCLTRQSYRGWNH